MGTFNDQGIYIPLGYREKNGFEDEQVLPQDNFSLSAIISLSAEQPVVCRASARLDMAARLDS